MRPSIIFLAQTIKGSGRGKRLGSPTINLALDQVPEALKEGVYAVRASVGTAGERSPAVMHFGPRPTFEDSPSCELHFLGKSQVLSPQPSPSAFAKPTSPRPTAAGRAKLRGPEASADKRLRQAGKSQVLTVEVVQRLRDVRKFESEEALKRQIAKDVEHVKFILGI